MDAKTIKRILSAILAAALLAFGGRELLAHGFTVNSVAPGVAGLVFLFSAVTGKG